MQSPLNPVQAIKGCNASTEYMSPFLSTRFIVFDVTNLLGRFEEEEEEEEAGSRIPSIDVFTLGHEIPIRSRSCIFALVEGWG